MQYDVKGGYYCGFSRDEIFFMEACMMLCFGFLMKRLLVTQMFSYCRAVLTQSQGHFLCSPASEEPGRNITRTTDPNWPKGHPIPYVARHSNESWGREGGGREC